MQVRRNIFGDLPPVVKNLLIINVIFYIGSIVISSTLGIRIEDYLGLHLPMAEKFGVYQLFTYMFLHAYPDPSHIFFNMFALFMFGRLLESVWGSRRFLVYYLVTGVGAALIHMITQYYEVMPILKEISFYMNNSSHENLQDFLSNYHRIGSIAMRDKFNIFVQAYNSTINVDPSAASSIAREYLYNYRADFLNAYITVGASGAVFGILLAFGMLFPNMKLMLLFPPIPFKAKYFVIFYGILELYLALKDSPMDNVAHFAHLGGMLFGFILIKYWQKKGINY